MYIEFSGLIFLVFRVFLAVACILAFFSHVNGVYAQAVCDTEFRGVMNANAWRSAKREIETAERLILKPDSVLEYSCLMADFTSSGGSGNWNTTGGLSPNPYTPTSRPSSDIIQDYIAQQGTVLLARHAVIQVCLNECMNRNQDPNQPDYCPFTRSCGTSFDFNSGTWGGCFQSGDVNGDGVVNSADSSFLSQCTFASDATMVAWGNEPATDWDGNPIGQTLAPRFGGVSGDLENALQRLDYLYAELLDALQQEQQAAQSVQPDSTTFNYTGDDVDYSVGVMGTFLTSNFGGDFAGGLYTGQSGVCIDMQGVWNFLKCQDFDYDNDADDFRVFSEYGTNDYRTYYAACSAEPDRATRWADAHIASNPVAGGIGGADPIVHLLGRFSWMADNVQCSDVRPIPTGVRATNDYASRETLQGANVHNDGVCPLPGCYVSSDGNRCLD